MGSRSVLLLAVVAVACGGGQAARESADGGHQRSGGGSGTGSGGGSSGTGSSDGSADSSGDGPGDDASGVLDAGQGIVFPLPVVPSEPPVTCMGPWQYGGSSGAGGQSFGWEELCSNGHLYMTFCDYPSCDCECDDESFDAGTTSDTQTSTQTCHLANDPYSFSRCGFPE
jgi:hypothetical protein